MNLRNHKQVETELNKVLLEILNVLSKEMLSMLREEIQEATYEADYFPNKWYEYGDGTDGSGMPSFEFKNAFKWKESKKGSFGEIKKELYYAWQEMTVNKATGRHWDNGKDIRKKLAEYLNVDDVFGGKERFAYWDNFINQMDTVFYDLFEEQMTKKGLKFTKGKTSIIKDSPSVKNAVENMGKAMDDFLWEMMPSLI
jgi:hypothetical protein